MWTVDSTQLGTVMSQTGVVCQPHGGQVVFRAIMDCGGYTKTEKEAYIMATFDENCEWGYPPRERVLECLGRDFNKWEKTMGDVYLMCIKI